MEASAHAPLVERLVPREHLRSDESIGPGTPTRGALWFEIHVSRRDVPEADTGVSACCHVGELAAPPASPRVRRLTIFAQQCLQPLIAVHYMHGAGVNLADATVLIIGPLAHRRRELPVGHESR